MAATTAGFSSADALAILKESYAEKDVQNLIERNSPTLARIKKVPGYGKYYVIPMMYSRGGAVSSDFTKMTALVSSTARNKAMQVTYGQVFSGFAISPKEHLASDSEPGAFIQLIREYYFASTEALRKTIGGAIFGMGYGEVAPVLAIDAGAQLFVTMSAHGAMMLDIGSKVQFATGPLPDGAYRAGGAVTVSKIEDLGNDTVKVTFSSAYGAAVAVGDWVEIDGTRDGSGNPLLFVGLRGWLPTIGNRTGATWASYIGTSFFGVDRSVYPSRLAGQFVLRNSGASEKYSEALVRGVRLARRAGSVPDMIVLNDVDFGTVINEIKAAQTQWQAINGPNAGGELKATTGISSLMFAFSNTWIGYVVDDPYCPVGIGYVLETESVAMAMLSNKQPIDTELPMTNEGGSPKVASASTPPMEYRWNIDDLLATAPSDTVDGQGARVTTQFFGAFFVRNPAHCCVVKFDPTLAA
jgi:hypothetical protein